MRNFDKAFLFKASILLIIYIFLFFGSSDLISYFAKDLKVQIGGLKFKFLTFYVPLSFLLFSLSAILSWRRKIIFLDLFFYLFQIIFCYILSRWETIDSPFFLIKFSYLVVLYIKLLPLLIYLQDLIQVGSRMNNSRVLKKNLFAVSFVFFVSLTFLDLCSRNLSGDEPHYLLAAHSLVHDHDFELVNNYEQRDYRGFYRGYLSSRDAGKHEGLMMLTQLGYGFPLIITPGYALLGRLGAQLTINIIASLTLVNLLLILIALFKPRKGIGFIFSCCLISSPFLIYSRALYPEMLIALVLIFLVRIAMNRASPDPLFCLAFILLSSLLLITKIKSVFILLTLSSFMVHRFVKSKKIFIKFLMIMFIILLYIPFIDYYIFGKVFFGKIADYALGVFTNPPSGLIGLLFDQEAGLIPEAPIFFIAFIELLLFIFIKKEREDRILPLLFLFVVNYIFIGFWQLWHGLSTPSPRYLVPLLPLFVIFLARAWERRSGFLFFFFNCIFAILTLIYGFLQNLVPDFWYNWCDGTNTLFEHIGVLLNADLVSLLPSFIRSGPYALWQLLWIVCLVFFTSMFFMMKSSYYTYIWTKRAVILFIVGIFSISALFGYPFFHFARKLPTHVVELEDISPDVKGDLRRFPLEVDPWYEGRYLANHFDNGIILYPSEKVEIDVNLKKADFDILIYLFRGKKIKNEPILSVAFDGSEQKNIVVDNYSWNEFIELKPENLKRFSEITLMNNSIPADEEKPKYYGIVIDKVVFAYH